MLALLKHLFFPTESNNQKAKFIHLSSLLGLIFLLAVFQSGLNLLTKIKPGVLGFAADISIEKLLEYTNNKREEAGLMPLTLNSVLNEAAQQKASAMFAFNCWSHNCNGQTPWWFFKNAGYDYTFAGENLARDFGESGEVVTAWMESPTHRDNLLSDKYKEIGFAVVNGILNNEETTLVVQMFGTPAQNQAVGGGAKTETEEARVLSREKRPAGLAQIMAVEPVGRTGPAVSGFLLSKAFALALAGLLIFIFALDSILIYQKKIIRVSGKSFIHLSFFVIIFLAILLSYQGQIL